MSPEPTEGHAPPGHDPDATHRQRFGLILAIGVGSIAGGFSYFGTRDVWVTGDRRPAAVVAAPSVVGDGPSLGPGLSGGAVPGRFPDVVRDLPLGPPSPQPAAVPKGEVGRSRAQDGGRLRGADDPRGRIPCRGLLARRPAARSLTGRPSSSNIIPGPPGDARTAWPRRMKNAQRGRRRSRSWFAGTAMLPWRACSTWSCSG